MKPGPDSAQRVKRTLTSSSEAHDAADRLLDLVRALARQAAAADHEAATTK